MKRLLLVVFLSGICFVPLLAQKAITPDSNAVEPTAVQIEKTSLRVRIVQLERKVRQLEKTTERLLRDNQQNKMNIKALGK